MCLAIPGRIEELAERPPRAVVDVMGVRREVSIDLLCDDPLAVGDWVLIHVGFAMSKISAEDAEEQLKLLSMLGGVGEAEEEAAGYGLGEAPE
ncbi:MAG: HypC/HybG/HupF family hydrogenase formation chaperone [Planctomycetota bacterium]|jgi:hydrogenase expression/formation protein HypC